MKQLSQEIPSTGLPFTAQMEAVAQTIGTETSQRLREIASDPMRADHCEVRKSTLISAAEELERYVAAAVVYHDELVLAHAEIHKLRLAIFNQPVGRPQ
jgi:hypothetical protein